MNDKTFTQALEELNQRAVKEITDEALRCWTILQREGTVDAAIAHIENEHKRDAVRYILLYVQLQSVLFDAKHRHMISNERYEELRQYVDVLTNQMKQQPFTVLPLPTA